MSLPSNREITAGIPGFQEIKRQRESLGQGFWMYSEALFPQIENGDWNTALPSLASLLRELRKIELQPLQKLRVNNLALTAERGLYEEVRGRLQRTTSAAQSLQGQFSPELPPPNMVSVRERGIQDLSEGLESTQLMYSTGRLIQSYGQLLKSAHIAPDRSFKKDLDYLTTFVTIRKLFRRWN